MFEMILADEPDSTDKAKRVDGQQINREKADKDKSVIETSE